MKTNHTETLDRYIRARYPIIAVIIARREPGLQGDQPSFNRSAPGVEQLGSPPCGGLVSHDRPGRDRRREPGRNRKSGSGPGKTEPDQPRQPADRFCLQRPAPLHGQPHSDAVLAGRSGPLRDIPPHFDLSKPGVQSPRRSGKNDRCYGLGAPGSLGIGRSSEERRRNPFPLQSRPN